MGKVSVTMRLDERIVDRMDAEADRRSQLEGRRVGRTDVAERALGRAFGVAARYQPQPGPDVTRVRSSGQAKRGVAPVPKTKGTKA